MLRVTIPMIIASAVLSTGTAMAQLPPEAYAAPPPLQDPHLVLYCVYGNLLYSIGATLCVGEGSFRCEVPTNKTNPNERPNWIRVNQDPGQHDCQARR